MPTREEAAEEIMAHVVSRVEGLVELAKLSIASNDGGKAEALVMLAAAVDDVMGTKEQTARFVSVLIVDRALRELGAHD